MPTSYTVTQTAAMLGTSTATLRRLADEMVDVLPDYQHVTGQARRFSDNDVKTLHALSTRLQASPGLTRSELSAQLASPDSEPLIIPDALPAASPQDAPERPKADRAIQTDVASPQNAILPFLQAQDDTRQQIARLSAQIERIAQERPQIASPHEWRFAVAITLSVGLLLAGVTVSAILRDSQAALLTSVLALIVLIAAIVWPTLRR